MSPEIPSDSLTLGLVLFSALLHASWNALTKASGDSLVNLAVVLGTGGLFAIPAILFFPVPAPEVWPWLAVSAVIHFAYQLALVRTYQLGDLSQVYPIARGLAPLLVATLAAIGAGEGLSALQLTGLVLASCAIMALAGVGSRGPSTGRAVAMALVTACMIGGYTYVDGRGVRLVQRTESYIAWSFLLGSVPIVLTTWRVRGRAGLEALRSGGLHAFGGGVMATLGYGIVLWAMSRTTMASVASLRESSVLFAALIGTQMLGEPFGRRRLLAAVTLVVGLVLVQIGKV